MLKKFEKIIKGVINPNCEQTKKAQFLSDTGFYYVTDGFRVVRFEDEIKELPIFEDGEKQYNNKRLYEQANEAEYDSLEIPYTIDQIKAWQKETRKIGKNLRFKLGVSVRINLSPIWLAINPKFLIDAMETTQSNIIYVPCKGQTLLMQGNGFTWLIMPVATHGFESDKHMTEIPIE